MHNWFDCHSQKNEPCILLYVKGQKGMKIIIDEPSVSESRKTFAKAKVVQNLVPMKRK